MTLGGFFEACSAWVHALLISKEGPPSAILHPNPAPREVPRAICQSDLICLTWLIRPRNTTWNPSNPCCPTHMLPFPVMLPAYTEMRAAALIWISRGAKGWLRVHTAGDKTDGSQWVFTPQCYSWRCCILTRDNNENCQTLWQISLLMIAHVCMK